jgi:hypothetical protein
MGKEEASGLRGKTPSGNGWAPLAKAKDLALQPYFLIVGRLWDEKIGWVANPMQTFLL